MTPWPTKLGCARVRHHTHAHCCDHTHAHYSRFDTLAHEMGLFKDASPHMYPAHCCDHKHAPTRCRPTICRRTLQMHTLQMHTLHPHVADTHCRRTLRLYTVAAYCGCVLRLRIADRNCMVSLPVPSLHPYSHVKAWPKPCVVTYWVYTIITLLFQVLFWSNRRV